MIMSVLTFMLRLVELFHQIFTTFLSTKLNTTHYTCINATTHQVSMEPQVLVPYSKINNNGEDFNYSMGRREINMVMERLGIEFDHHESGVDCVVDAFVMFDDDDDDNNNNNGRVVLSWEVRDAFDVFDKNKDGYIDQKELQIVLCALGLQQGSQLELEECRRMISEFDDNGDGLIDFQEFFKLIRYSFTS